MTTSDSIDQIATALVAVQAEIKDPAATARNPQLGNAYAELADILGDIRPTLSKHGIAIIQSPGLTVDGDVDRATLTTRLLHVSGQWVEGTARTQMNEPNRATTPVQMYKGAVTMMRRTSALSMTGVAERDDNDGTIRGGHDATAVHDLGIGTAQEAAVEASPQSEGAAAPSPATDAGDVARKQNLQGALMDEFARLNVDPDAVKANCQKLAGVDTIFQLTVEQLETALASIRKRKAPAEVQA